MGFWDIVGIVFVTIATIGIFLMVASVFFEGSDDDNNFSGY